MYRLLIFTIIISLTKTNTLEDDGVLIQPEGKTKSIEMMWSTVVVLHPPRKLPINEWVSQVQEVVKRTGNRATDEDKRIWDKRLTAIRLTARNKEDADDVTIPTHHQRVRRGLFDVVGKTASWLFGTATEEEVDQIKKSLELVKNEQTITKHFQDQLLTVVNTTRRYVQENRLDIQNLAKHQELLEEAIRYEIHAFRLTRMKLSWLKLARFIDSIIDELYIVFREYCAQWDTFHNKRHELERGYLTENILSRNELGQILFEIKSLGYMVAHKNWYYQYTKIDAFLQEEERLIYKFHVYGFNHKEYLQFNFRYFPVTAGKNHLRVIVGNDKIAVDTVSQYSFFPHECIGMHPRACIITSETVKDSCEKNLVIGRNISSCNLRVFKRDNISSNVYRIKESEVIIVAYEPTVVIERCAGEAATRDILKGLHVRTIKNACILESHEWRIHGIVRYTQNVTKTFPRLTFNNSLKFSMPLEMEEKIIDKLRFTKRVEIPAIEFKRYDPKLENSFKNRSWIMYSIIGIILTILAIQVPMTILYIKQRKILTGRTCHWPWKKQKHLADLPIESGPTDENNIASMLE